MILVLYALSRTNGGLKSSRTKMAFKSVTGCRQLYASFSTVFHWTHFLCSWGTVCRVLPPIFHAADAAACLCFLPGKATRRTSRLLGCRCTPSPSASSIEPSCATWSSLPSPSKRGWGQTTPLTRALPPAQAPAKKNTPNKWVPPPVSRKARAPTWSLVRAPPKSSPSRSASQAWRSLPRGRVPVRY